MTKPKKNKEQTKVVIAGLGIVGVILLLVFIANLITLFSSGFVRITEDEFEKIEECERFALTKEAVEECHKNYLNEKTNN